MCAEFIKSNRARGDLLSEKNDLTSEIDHLEMQLTKRTHEVSILK
jgi:hypothetical protein